MEPVGRLRGHVASLSNQPDAFYLAQIQGVEGIVVRHSFGNALGCSQGVCPGGERFLYLDALGRISPCTWVNDLLPEYRSHLTLNEASLRELLASLPIHRYRNEVVTAHAGCPIAHLKRGEPQL